VESLAGRGEGVGEKYLDPWAQVVDAQGAFPKQDSGCQEWRSDIEAQEWSMRRSDQGVGKF
jgi:hypothetical protein